MGKTSFSENLMVMDGKIHMEIPARPGGAGSADAGPLSPDAGGAVALSPRGGLCCVAGADVSGLLVSPRWAIHRVDREHPKRRDCRRKSWVNLTPIRRTAIWRRPASGRLGLLNTCGCIAKAEEPKGICLRRRSPASLASCPASCSPP